MKKVAIAIVCKTPSAGFSKTRLSPPLTQKQAAQISGCFIRDLAATIAIVCEHGEASPYALYTPVGTEDELRSYLPPSFELLAQRESTFGDRLGFGAEELLSAGHAGVILVNSDSPTLPVELLGQAVDAVLMRNNVVLSPAFDGGYTLIGISRAHHRLFQDIPWSTEQVYRCTLERAKEIALPVVTLPGWYDVDDETSLSMLFDELDGKAVAHLEGICGAKAPATRQFVFDLKRAGSR